jgi:hypothetical protein
MFEGGCYCGQVRYAIDEGTYLVANCHCTMCRRIHAAPYVTWMMVPIDRFRYLGEPPATLRSSPEGTRYFCNACGTHLACIDARHPEIAVTLSSTDTPDRFSPTVAVFTDTRLPWVPDDGLAQP